MKQFLKEKISEAKEALSQKKVWFKSNISLSEFYSLQIDDTKEIFPLIQDLLEEVSHRNFVRNSNGLKFVWKSKKLHKKMSLGFDIKNGGFYYFFLKKV